MSASQSKQWKMSTDRPGGTEQASIKIGIGGYAVTTTGAELVTHGLGSCVGITLFDETAGVAGLIHIKRPSQNQETKGTEAWYADTGTELLATEMRAEGARLGRLNATIAGGSNMCDFSRTEKCIGERNVIQAVETLDELGVDIVGKDTGGTVARSLYFDGQTGSVVIKS